MYVFSYDKYSESATALAKALGVPLAWADDKLPRITEDTKIINWGCSDLPRAVRWGTIINEENAVGKAINKIKAFTTMTSSEENVRCVPWTTKAEEAIEWMADGHRVFQRSRVKGKDGEGLREITINEELDGKLWTKKIECVKEYRVTMVCSTPEVYACQRKVLLTDFDGVVNHDIKTSSNGYGFKFVTMNIPDDVVSQARKALKSLGLQFGGVDAIWDGQQAWVLEVNTAPHLTPRTLTTLLPAFKSLLSKE